VKIIAISDLHTYEPDIPEGDVLVCAGDITFRGTALEIVPMLTFLGEQPHKHKILIAGNHDWLFERNPEFAKELCEQHGITYLEDSGVEIDGVKFWGSPVQPEFCDWAFNRSINDDMYHSRYPHIKPHWDMIPEDTDVLITHGPPSGILDRTQEGRHVGCPHLLKRIEEVKPKLHISGHIHEGYGKQQGEHTLFVNASICTLKYKPINKPIEISI